MFYVGVMSGTSCDGVDVVVVQFSEAGLSVVAAQTTTYPNSIKQLLLKLIADEALPISTVSQLDAQLGFFYAKAINHLLSQHSIDADKIKAIGLHGQTVWHQPPNQSIKGDDEKHFSTNTIQLGSAVITAQQTAITTVANFRQMDVAHGGQGAPLAPALHQQLFSQTDKTVAVLNLGGIANITLLKGDEVIGFDTGPASCLMDEYIQSQRNQPFDAAGQWARSGSVSTELLTKLMAEDYFKIQAPKSTGRELFNLAWLVARFNALDLPLKPADVQRTLLQLTVESIALGVEQSQRKVDEMVVCGGGTHNDFLMQQLQQRFEFKVQSSAVMGMDPDFIEATLMAWLAKLNLNGGSLDLRKITGCRTPHVYGVQFKP